MIIKVLVIKLRNIKKYNNFSLATKTKHTKYQFFSNRLEGLIQAEISSDEKFIQSYCCPL